MHYRSMVAISLFIVVIFLTFLFWTVRNGISPMPTAPKVKKALLKALPNHIDGTIVDLGSGWGTLCFALAKKYPNCPVVGYESSPIPYYYSVIKKVFCGPDNVTFKRRDFFTVSMNHASLILCYLYPRAMQKLKEKFASELKPGTLVISHTFAIPSLKPDKIITVSDLYNSRIYFYTSLGR